MYNSNLFVINLRKWVVENNAKQKTREVWKKSIIDYYQEDPIEYESIFGEDSPDNIVLGDATIFFMIREFDKSEELYVRILVRYDVYYKNKKIGYYKGIFTVDGVFEDDELLFW